MKKKTKEIYQTIRIVGNILHSQSALIYVHKYES